MMKEKIVSIQYLRGLAALGVVFCHYSSSLILYPLLSVFFSFGQSGVFVFFLISGFIIVYSLIKSNYETRQFFTFLLKRSLRIDPPYYVVILSTLVLFKILSHIPSFKGESIDFIPAQFIAHVFYVVPFTKYPFYNHVFWTLCIEFQFYVLIGVFYFLTNKWWYRVIFLLLFSLSSLIPFSNAYYVVFTYGSIFALGISLVSFYRERKWQNIIMPLYLITVIAVQFGVPIFILLFLSCVAIFYFSLIIRPLAFLGDVSYSLYLTHPIVFIVFSGIAKRLNIDLNSYQLFWLFVEISIALFFAYVFCLIIEKPSINLSKRIFYKRFTD